MSDYSDPLMITDIDETLLRDGIALAVGRELDLIIRDVTAMAGELHHAGLIDRAKWDAMFATVAALPAKVNPALQYARCFLDQWPEPVDES